MTYPALASLLGGYFHQDWDIVADTPDGVLDAYVAETEATTVRAACAEATRFAAEHPNGLLAAFQAAFQPDISIGSDDEAAEAWLQWLRDALNARLAARA